MFFAIAIDEVNKEINRLHGVPIMRIPFRRVHHIYVQYCSQHITLQEAAQNIHGVLFDNELIEG